ncbi:MAG: GNAT family N-acetyltransferase [Coprobacillaceae bacterium]
MIQYRLAKIEEIDFLVELRLKEMAMFTDIPFPKEHIEDIRSFYELKMKDNTCFTVLGYDKDILVTTGMIYFYHSLASNANPSGKTGYISNIWTHDQYRRQGIASEVMDQLLELAKGKCGMVCLNASEEGRGLYEKKSFVQNERAMIYIMKE